MFHEFKSLFYLFKLKAYNTRMLLTSISNISMISLVTGTKLSFLIHSEYKSQWSLCRFFGAFSNAWALSLYFFVHFNRSANVWPWMEHIKKYIKYQKKNVAFSLCLLHIILRWRFCCYFIFWFCYSQIPWYFLCYCILYSKSNAKFSSIFFWVPTTHELILLLLIPVSKKFIICFVPLFFSRRSYDNDLAFW